MLQSLLLNEVKLTICLQKYMYNKINTCTYMYLHTVVDHYHADLTLYNNFNQSYEDCMHASVFVGHLEIYMNCSSIMYTDG